MSSVPGKSAELEIADSLTEYVSCSTTTFTMLYNTMDLSLL
jgi:hypothetical protein